MRRLVLFLVALVAAGSAAVPAVGVHPARPPLAQPETDRGIPALNPAPMSKCRKLGHATFSTTNVNVIYGDGLVQKGGNRGCYTPQNEPAIAVDPTNPANVVAGANDYRLCCDSVGRNDGTGWAYVSHDGGATWSDILLPGLTVETGGHQWFAKVDAAGDPAVAFTSSGRVLYANIGFSRSSPVSSIEVSASNDAGRQWHLPHVIAYADDPAIFLDKDAIAAGPHGLVAVTWTRFDSAEGLFGDARIYTAISHDNGSTWGAPIEVAPGQSISQGTAPVFAPDGTLYVAYETVEGGLFGVDEVAYSYLKPGSRSFRVVPVGVAFDGCYPVNSDKRPTLTNENFRTGSMPAAAVDPATGTLAVVWTDDEQGCGQPRSDSQAKLVTAHLAHHSSVRTITEGADKTMPAVAYRNRVITVGFYTESFADFRRGVDYAYASSADGWVEHRVSDGSSDAYMQFGGSFIGDYTAAAEGADGVVHFAWADSRGGDQNVFTQAVKP